jgi:phosphotransferase system enzyme I (PtsI)
MIADVLAREVDFFSIGTNDLIQYSIAVDRNNEHVAHLYQPLHPGILRMLRFIVDSARAAGIEVSLCGEMGGDPRFALMLIGLGMRRLSMSPRRIPEVKAWLREAAVAELSEMATQCLQHSTAAEVQEHLDTFVECSRSSRVSA